MYVIVTNHITLSFSYAEGGGRFKKKGWGTNKYNPVSKEGGGGAKSFRPAIFPILSSISNFNETLKYRKQSKILHQPLDVCILIYKVISYDLYHIA